MKWLMMALLMVSTACAGSSGNEMKELKQAVDGYNTAFRWKNFHRAAAYLPNDLRTAFVTYFDEESASLHIEAVEILKVDMESDEAAEVTVRYRYMLLPSVVVQRKIVKQSWHRVDGAWILETEEPPLIDYTSAASEPDPESEWSTPDSWDPR